MDALAPSSREARPETGTVSTPPSLPGKTTTRTATTATTTSRQEKPLPPPSGESENGTRGRPANAILLDDLHAYDTVNEKWTEVLSSLAPLPTKGHHGFDLPLPSSETEEEQSQSLNLSAVPYLICFGGTSQYSSTKTDQMSFCKVESAAGEGVGSVHARWRRSSGRSRAR